MFIIPFLLKFFDHFLKVIKSFEMNYLWAFVKNTVMFSLNSILNTQFLLKVKLQSMSHLVSSFTFLTRIDFSLSKLFR